MGHLRLLGGSFRIPATSALDLVMVRAFQLVILLAVCLCQQKDVQAYSHPPSVEVKSMSSVFDGDFLR